MPTRESSNDIEAEEDWQETTTRYLRWALYGITTVAVLLILVLIFILEPAPPPAG